MPIRNMGKSSTSLVFDSRSNIRWNITRFKFFDCCSQSRPNWCRYWKFLLGGAIVGLSVATHYGVSKSMHPFVISQPTLVTSLWWFLVWWLHFQARPWAKLTSWRVSPPSNLIWELTPPAHKTSSLEKFGGFITPKPFMSFSCWKPCRHIASSEPFQDCCQYSTPLPTLN
jgi:hypothetical protein